MCIGYLLSLSVTDPSYCIVSLTSDQTSAASRLFASLSLSIPTAISPSSEVLILNTQRATSADAVIYDIQLPSLVLLLYRYAAAYGLVNFHCYGVRDKRDQQYGPGRQAYQRTGRGMSQTTQCARGKSTKTVQAR